jgi:hypothetical protein
LGGHSSVRRNVRAGDSPETELLRDLLDHALGPGLLVIDDRPSEPQPELLDQLARIAATVRETGARILCTAQTSLPATVKAAVGLASEEIPIPPMTEQDVAALMNAAGAPAHIVAQSSVFIAAAAHGHPGLILQAVGWFARELDIRPPTDGGIVSRGAVPIDP